MRLLGQKKLQGRGAKQVPPPLFRVKENLKNNKHFREEFYWIDGYTPGDFNWTTYGFREKDDNRYVQDIRDFRWNRYINCVQFTSISISQDGNKMTKKCSCEF